MSQRVRELLDEAAAGVTPRNADPAAAVIRRGRAARARAVTAGGLALVAVVTGSVVAGAQLMEDPPHEAGAAPAEATRPDRPPTPQVVKGRVVAGAMSIAPPKGWQVVAIDKATCGYKPRTVLIGEGTNPHGPSFYCTTAEVEVLSMFDFLPYGFKVGASPADAWLQSPFAPPKMSTLDGGEPLWLRTDADGEHRVVLPWSRVEITVRGDADVRQQVLDSLSTGRWAPDALMLPELTEYAALTMSTDGGVRKAELTDPAKVLRARELLRGAATVEQGASCAREDQPTVELELGGRFQAASFMISLADGCYEAVAEEGGRARLDAAGLTELGTLFGVQLP